MLTLYEHPFALYCQKVLIALNELGVAYDVREEQRDFDRAQLAELWPPASIPVLRDGERIIGETSIIIEHVAGTRLVPSLEARLWDRICDQYVSDAVQAIIADTFEERSSERKVAQRYYRALAQRPSFAKVIEDARPYRDLFPLPWPANFDRYH
jgi:glutathione S-transferase